MQRRCLHAALHVSLLRCVPSHRSITIAPLAAAALRASTHCCSVSMPPAAHLKVVARLVVLKLYVQALLYAHLQQRSSAQRDTPQQRKGSHAQQECTGCVWVQPSYPALLLQAITPAASWQSSNGAASVPAAAPSPRTAACGTATASTLPPPACAGCFCQLPLQGLLELQVAVATATSEQPNN